MGKRQQTYRDRRLAEGWERIELLVPAEAAPWLRAYARALRDAANLGRPMPCFDGIGATASSNPVVPRTPPLSQPASGSVSTVPTMTQPDMGARPESLKAPKPTIEGDETDRLIRQMEARQNSDAITDAERPDFRRGLLG